MILCESEEVFETLCPKMICSYFLDASNLNFDAIKWRQSTLSSSDSEPLRQGNTNNMIIFFNENLGLNSLGHCIDFVDPVRRARCS